MFWSNSEQRKRRLERDTLYTMSIETTRVVGGDFVIYNFSDPLYIRRMHVNADCYYYDDTFIPSFIGNGTPGIYPVFNFDVGGSGRYSINNIGVGTYTRLRTGLFYQFYPEPLRVRKMFIAPISGSVVLTLHYLFS